MNQKYDKKWIYFGLIIMTGIFCLFYIRCAESPDMYLHTLVAKALLNQSIQNAKEEFSLFPVHVYAYPGYHLVQKLVHFILQVDYETAAALVLSLSAVISVLLYRKLMLMMMEDTVFNRYFADVVSMGAVLFGVARCWLNDWRYYQFQCAANPFHNPTILFVRPFGIACYIYFIKYVKTYKQKCCYKFAALFGITALLSVIAKPSFAIVFLPALGIYTLIYIIKNKELRFGTIALFSVLPSLVLLVFQQIWVSSNSEALNTTIKFGGFTGMDTWQIIGATIVTFPVVFLLFRISLLKKEPAYFISMMALLIGWMQMYLLNSGVTGDFSWGYDLSVQFAVLTALAESRNGEAVKRKIVNYASYFIFAYQVLVGIKYLWTIYTTAEFWI